MPALLLRRCDFTPEKLLLLLCCHVVRVHHTASLGALITEVFVLLTRAVEWCMAVLAASPARLSLLRSLDESQIDAALMHTRVLSPVVESTPCASPVQLRLFSCQVVDRDLAARDLAPASGASCTTGRHCGSGGW